MPLYGTAVQVDLWLLIEYARPWKPKALEDNELETGINEHLAELVTEVREKANKRLRVQFIKQATSDNRADREIMLASVTSDTASMIRSKIDKYQSLIDITSDRILENSLPSSRAVEKGVYLVCTNGQRDLCCARFGLPVYEALRAEYGDRVWQTTHVGGHRYAPNLLCLPSGIGYGFAESDVALELASRTDRGELDVDYLRGRSCYPSVVQAAEYFVRKERRLSDLFGINYLGHEIEGDEIIVKFDIGGQAVAVVIAAAIGEAAIASCNGPPKPVEEFNLVSIE